MSGVQRAWVGLLLALLAVPGVVGFDLWPLTGWRLFSLSRDATQTEWALDVDGREVDLEQLPLAFRNAAWPMAELPRASEARQQDVCEALLVGVRAAFPEADQLELVREVRHLDVDDGEERITEDREVIHGCG
jgi:hypothetical protein